MSAFDLTAEVIHQIGAPAGLCCAEGGTVTCVNPHRVLYDTVVAAPGQRVRLRVVAAPDPAGKDEG